MNKIKLHPPKRLLRSKRVVKRLEHGEAKGCLGLDLIDLDFSHVGFEFKS
jgi:hypothetical protein